MNNKINILLPIAGNGQRFVDRGFVMPKPLIMARDKQIIDWSLSSIDTTNCNLIFVVKSEHVDNFSIDRVLKQKFGEDIQIIVSPGPTEGTLCSCLLAEKLIDNDAPVLVYCPDVYFEKQFKPYNIKNKDFDGAILTFKSNNNAYSYVQVDENGLAVRTAEKSVISNNAAVGAYYFSQGSEFVRLGKEMIKRNLRTKNEFYICPLYNLFIENNKKIVVEEVEKMYVIGTPEEYDFFVNKALNKFGEKPVAICSDHSGIKLKEITKKILLKQNIKVIDFGTYTEKDCDYYDYVSQATEAVVSGLCGFGIGFCRSGQGINISANKTKSIRSAYINDEYTAEYAIKHNCANFFAVPEKYVDEVLMTKIIEIWKKTTFDGGRHQTRLMKMEQS